MKQKEEAPGSLGGPSDMLSAEVLEKINGLLQQLQQAGCTNQGSKIEIVYVASGGQHVETQINIGTHPWPLPKGRGVDTFKGEKPDLPESLTTEEAMALWQKAQEAGYVDEHYQPAISRTQSALLADAMAERLGIREKWKVFEALWNRKYMRSDYNLALTQQQSLDFQDELKRLFADK